MICNCTKLILDKQSKCLVRSEAYALHKQKHTSGAGCGDEVCQVSQTRSRDLGATGPCGRQQWWLLGGWQVTWMKGQRGNGGGCGVQPLQRDAVRKVLWHGGSGQKVDQSAILPNLAQSKRRKAESLGRGASPLPFNKELAVEGPLSLQPASWPPSRFPVGVGVGLREELCRNIGMTHDGTFGKMINEQLHGRY